MLACFPSLTFHSQAFQDLGKVLLMLQTISQELSKNSWMQVSHSYFNIQLFLQWLLISELLLKEQLGVAQLESLLVTPQICAVGDEAAVFISLAGSSPPKISSRL